MLAVVIGAFLAWNSFTLRRAKAQLEAVGLSVNWTSSLMHHIRHDPGVLLHPGAWGNPINWPGVTEVWSRDANAKASLRNLDTIASALRRIRPKQINLTGWPLLENVDGLNGLDRLEYLFINDCPALQDVNGLSSFASLKLLSVSNCSSLRNVDGIKGLTGLRGLDLDGSNGIPAAALRELRAALPKTIILFPDRTNYPPE